MQQCVTPNALSRSTESGYVNTALYKEYIRYLETFIPGMTL